MAPPLFWGAPTLTFTRGCFAPSLIENRGGAWHLPLSGHPRAGGFWVLGCSDPLFSTVRSDLPASSSSAKDLRCAAWISLPSNSRLQFRATAQKNFQLLCSNPATAAYSKTPNTLYTLYTLYLFLVFAEYTPILLPILQRKHRCLCVRNSLTQP